MKKPALLILSLSALLTLASCSVNTNKTSSDGGASETSSAISDGSSSEETPKTATVKAVYCPLENQSREVSVCVGDTIATEGTITLKDKDAGGNYDYQIYINGTIDDMTRAADGITYTYDYEVDGGSDVTIGFSKKSKTAADGYTITFDQEGAHYTIFGITSGQKYKAYTDDSGESSVDYDVWFTVIPEDGYYLDSVNIKKGDSDPIDAYNYRNGVTLDSDDLTADATILVDVKKGKLHRISYSDNTNVDWTIKPTSFVGGSQVRFSLAPKDGYAISRVDFGTSYSDVLNNDFSKYVAYLPDEDITISVDLNETFALKVEDDERISNVSFYDGNNGNAYSYNDDSTGFNLNESAKITNYVLGQDNSVVVAFNVVGNYKPKGISNIDSEGDDEWCLPPDQALDGRYTIRFVLASNKSIAIELATIRSVTLDSSSNMVNMEFHNSDTKYAAGDSVNFSLAVKDGYASQYRIKSVHYCYGENEETASYDDFNDQYSFTMPDSDVTIKVEMYQPVKATVSYVNNAGSLASSISLEGKTSGTAIGDDTSSNSFEEGEKVTITVKAGNSNPKAVKAYYKTADGTKTEIVEVEGDATYWECDVYQREYTGWFYVPKGGATVTIEEGDAATAVAISYKKDDVITFYASEDESSDCSSLTVYPMDVFYFSVGKAVADGEQLSVKLYNEYGDDYGYYKSVTIGGKTAYKVKAVNGPITIEAKALKSYSFTATTTDGEDASSFFEFADENGNSITATPGKALEGTLFKLAYPYMLDYTIQSITVGGGEPTTKYAGYMYEEYYVVTGDVVITLAPKASSN